ncbi:MAG: phage major capsid protein, partial [Clostridia bacterium]|nr:phage major capsid protein [Clostridia bacterium]
MVTISGADKALKTLYLGVITEQLNTETNPFLAKIKQTTADVWGKEVRRLAQYGINGGVGAGLETGNLPMAAGNNYEQLVCTLKNLYGTIEISDKAVRASENDAGAFVNLLNAEMEGLIKAATYNFGRMLFGDGTGVLTTVSSITDNVITVADTKNIIEGMVVDFIDSLGDPTTVTARRVNTVDRAANKIVVTGTGINSTALTSGT